MTKKILKVSEGKTFTQAMEELVGTKNVLKAKVVSLIRDKETNEDVLLLKFANNKGEVLIKRSKMGVVASKSSLVRLVGKELLFVVDSVVDGVVYGDRTEVETLELKAAHEELVEGLETEATILGFSDKGAFVGVGELRGLMANENFSDNSLVVHVHDVGDKVKVRLLEFDSETGYKFEAVEKHIQQENEGFNSLAKNQTVLGVVTNVETWGMFVRIRKGVDVLCSLPEDEVVEVGMEAVLRLTVIDEENRKLRGKAIRVTSKAEEDKEIDEFVNNLKKSEDHELEYVELNF